MDQILLVDRENLFGEHIAQHLAGKAAITLVTKGYVQESNISVIPFALPIPSIPDGDYASIVFVWKNEGAHLLEPLLKKAEEKNVKLFLISDSQDVPSHLVAPIIVGDIFTGKISEYPLDKFLYKTKTTKKIVLPGMGLHLWYPVQLQDAIEKISALILRGTSSKTIFIGPKHPFTALTISHALQRIDPEITIDFIHGEKGKEQTLIVAESVFEEYDSIEKLKQAYKKIIVKEKNNTKNDAHVVFSKKGSYQKKKLSIFTYCFYILLIILLLPFLSTLVGEGMGAFFLANGLRNLEKGNLVDSAQSIGASTQCFAFAHSSIDIAAKEASIIGQEKAIDMLRQKVVDGYTVSLLSENGVMLARHITSLLSGKSMSPVDEVLQAETNEKEFALQLDELPVQDVPAQYSGDFTNLKTLTSIASSVVDEFSQVIGAASDKKYLILFQNNMELRPGGGFIGSYGLLQLHHGAIQSFTIHNVYDADGQLQGHIEPPFAIRRYMPLVHLYLRDSNFDPDFANNAKIAANLFFQETNQQVDGVIGVDLQVLKTLLDVSGPVYMPSYNQTVTSINFFTLTEEHVDKNSFPGSIQKQDFLQNLASAIFAKLKGSPQVMLSKLLTETLQIFQGKHVLIGLADPLLQQSFALANLSSSLEDGRVTSPGVFNDFLGIVEANIGVSKVNAFITRTVTQHVAIDSQGNVQEIVQLNLTNASDGTWPGGGYKNYIRFIVPSLATLSTIAINNVAQNIIPAITSPSIYESQSFTAPKGLEVAKESESGKSLYGFLVIVPEKTTTSIQLTFSLPHVLSSVSSGSYNLFLWKQAGIDAYPYEFSLSLPNSLQFLKGTIPVARDVPTTLYNTQVSGDLHFSISFSQK